MIKINEACAILGLPEDDKGKEKARAVLNYFGVYSEDAEQTGHLKAGKQYARNQVEFIAKSKASLVAPADND